MICFSCFSWYIHIKNYKFKHIKENNIDFTCVKCVKASLDTLPFASLNDSNLDVLLNRDISVNFSNNVNLTPTKSKKLFYETCTALPLYFNNNSDDHGDDLNELFLTVESTYCDIDDFNDSLTNYNSSFSLAHLNIASLNNILMIYIT